MNTRRLGCVLPSTLTVDGLPFWEIPICEGFSRLLVVVGASLGGPSFWSL